MKIRPIRKDSDRVNIVVYIKGNENSTYKKGGKKSNMVLYP